MMSKYVIVILCLKLLFCFGFGFFVCLLVMWYAVTLSNFDNTLCSTLINTGAGRGCNNIHQFPSNKHGARQI